MLHTGGVTAVYGVIEYLFAEEEIRTLFDVQRTNQKKNNPLAMG